MVTLVRHDMELRISFNGQPTALRKFTSTLASRFLRNPKVSRPEDVDPAPPGKRGPGVRTGSRRGKVGSEEDDDEGPIGHPVRACGRGAEPGGGSTG